MTMDKTKLETAVEALEFYADYSGRVPFLITDGGEKARTALALIAQSDAGEEDKTTVTDIYCKCGFVHTFAGKQEWYLGSKLVATPPSSQGEYQKHASLLLMNAGYEDAADYLMSELDRSKNGQ